MTFILLISVYFTSFSQKDSTKLNIRPIYSLTDSKTKGTPTIRLRPTRFLVYQAIASISKADTKKEFSDVVSRSRDQITQSNIIPIGILNADIDIPNDKEKKKDFILMASPIEKDIFQANVQFQLSPKLLQTNLDNQIESIEISFDNGDTWESCKYEEQLINHQFTKIGEQSIGFRINSKKGTYVTFATVDVKQLVRPSYFETQRVSAPSVKGGRLATSVNGAEYRIIMGCDGIFDKPIIIAEGFDAGQNVNLDDLSVKYFDALALYRNNGYDLVLVNYDNGRTWIQDNAQVLKAVINQVNATKVGNNKLVVIGESMSGLVARWALKEMENAGQNPNVSHFIAFDSPMRGANVPTGFIKLRRWAPTALGLVSLYISFLNDVFGAYPIVQAIDEPAAKQILLTQEGSTPAPEFTQFQTSINNLGYPSQYGIKNIALINGALDGSNQRKYLDQDNPNGTYTEIDQGELNQGDKIFDFSFLVYFDVRVWTHSVSTNSKVAYADAPINILVPSSDYYLNSPVNYDRHPGGRFTSRTGSVYTSFAFVPTFSSIDYRGTLANNNNYYFNIRNFINGTTNQVTNTALTPFNAIYGDDRNDLHARPASETNAFNTFGVVELGMVNAGCQGCGTGTGLQGRFYDNIDLTDNANTQTSINSIEYSSDERRFTPGGSVTIGPPFPVSVRGTFPRANISARWEGSFEAPITANYTFNMRTDDGTRVWFDDVLRVNDWFDYGPTDHKFQVSLNAGQRKNIKIEWKQGSGGYEAKLWWEFNGVASIIPACRLFSTSVPTGGGDCSYTNGQFLFTFAASGENVYAHTCGAKYYATTDAGTGGIFKPNYWLVATSMMNQATANCFEVNDPRPAGCTSGGGGGGGGTGGSCSYTNGQFLFTFAASGENVYAHTCGTKYYATTDAGTGGIFKPNYWLVATGMMNQTDANCFEVNDPRPAGCTSGGGGGGGGGTGGSCSYTNGQFLFTFAASGENVYAHTCGTKYYATTDAGTGGIFKPNYWLVATGMMNQTDANCFEVNDPRPAGCTSGGGGGGGGGGGSCSYTDGQALTNWYGEDVRAYYCNGILYAKATGSNSFKPRSWLIATGRFTATEYNCFTETNPGCGANGRSGVGELNGLTFKNESELKEIEDFNVMISPNPTSGKVKVEFELLRASAVRLNIFDLQGKSLKINDFNGEKGENSIELDLTDFKHGSYLLNLQTDKERSAKRIIKID